MEIANFFAAEIMSIRIKMADVHVTLAPMASDFSS
jgi:hypothetical protein